MIFYLLFSLIQNKLLLIGLDMQNKIITSLDTEKLKEYCLVVGYFVSLFSATCFFFDTHQFVMFGLPQQLPIGLIFFPLTFAFSNILQIKFGKRTANSLILTAFIFDIANPK